MIVLTWLSIFWLVLSLAMFAMGCYSDRDDRGRWRWQCVIEGGKWAAEWPFALCGGLLVIGLVFLRECFR